MAEKQERRKFPRIKDTHVGVELSGEGFNTITQSLDVSASGIYCKVDRHIPVMTRVEVILTLPGRTKSGSAVKMDIEGVVVREHPVKKEGKIQFYDVAIFFNMLMPKERQKLIEYINRTSKDSI